MAAPLNRTAQPLGLNPVWMCGPMQQYSTLAWHRILCARQAVFVVEQNCAYPDADAVDEHSRHLSAWLRPETENKGDEPGQLLAYARLIPPGLKFEQAGLGRVLTSASVRRCGLGATLLERAIQALEQWLGPGTIRLSAQSHLTQFYGRQGFQTEGSAYLEDGIEHIDMVRAHPTRTLSP
jgi:ElaA protein